MCFIWPTKFSSSSSSSPSSLSLSFSQRFSDGPASTATRPSPKSDCPSMKCSSATMMTSAGGAEYHDYQRYVGGQSHSNFASVFTCCDYIYGTDMGYWYQKKILAKLKEESFGSKTVVHIIILL
ncbi:uncharacterized protein LOC110753633 [Prunus avium]|uniref:Uncharacterized protein LOC110753633 n=1 Tax=Prunus avium TaxID=42229 RepID=A0A6P5S9R4_PRUAV|nr:uncharacterized protein LOC110753633 [Prunus avium]